MIIRDRRGASKSLNESQQCVVGLALGLLIERANHCRLIGLIRRSAHREFDLRHLCRRTGHGEDTPRHDSRKVATIRLRLGSLQESNGVLEG